MLAASSTTAFFVHYVTPWSWLEKEQVEFVTELAKYIAIGFAFFTFGRKFDMIAEIIDKVAETINETPTS